MAVFAIGVEEVGEGSGVKVKERGGVKAVQGERRVGEEVDAATKAEAGKLRVNCCNNLAACHFQVCKLFEISKCLLELYLVSA